MRDVPQTRVTSDPNVTPFLDVLLVMLVVFMYICLNQQKLLDAQLPDPFAHAGDQTPSIVLEVTPEGGYAINRQPVAAGALGTRLRAIYAGRPDRTIIVRGARGARYQDVVAAVDSARGAGVAAIGLK